MAEHIDGADNHVLSAWTFYGTPLVYDWEVLLDTLISVLWEHTPKYRELVARRDALVARVEKTDPALARELDSAWGDHVWAAHEYAGQMGYALARTWPSTFEGLDDWLDKAKEFAGAMSAQREVGRAKAKGTGPTDA